MGSKWCTQCGAENDAEASFCRSCGKPMINGSRASGQSNTATTNPQEESTDNRQGRGFQSKDVSQLGYGFQNQGAQRPTQFQTKPKLKPENGAGLGFSAYVSVVVLIMGVILFFIGQQQLDSYAGLTWYYTEEAAIGNALRAGGGLCCILGVIGLIRYFVVKK